MTFVTWSNELCLLIPVFKCHPSLSTCKIAKPIRGGQPEILKHACLDDFQSPIQLRSGSTGTSIGWNNLEQLPQMIAHHSLHHLSPWDVRSNRHTVNDNSPPYPSKFGATSWNQKCKANSLDNTYAIRGFYTTKHFNHLFNIMHSIGE